MNIIILINARIGSLLNILHLLVLGVESHRSLIQPGRWRSRHDTGEDLEVVRYQANCRFFALDTSHECIWRYQSGLSRKKDDKLVDGR